jgi:hypothetical protein
VPLFEQLAKKGAFHLQKIISEKLHDHFFINIVVNLPFNSHHVRLRLCVGLGVDA